jgi:hypothetical protein
MSIPGDYAPISAGKPAVIAKPRLLPLLADNIPLAFRSIPAWIGWRLTYVPPANGKPGRWTKEPINIRTGDLAESDNPSTWAEFHAAVRTYQRLGCDGIGLCRTDDLVFIDLDGVLGPDGELLSYPWSAKILEAIDGLCYIEKSVTGTGLHAIGRGTLPPGRRQWNDREREHTGFALYDKNRYFTMSGHGINRVSNLCNLTAELAALHGELFPAVSNSANRSEPAHSKPGTLSDQELLNCAMRANDGGKFARLWRGQASDYPSASEADAALCLKLAFWTGRDPARIDALFRQSGLMRPKWEREDYRERTIRSACEMTKVWKSRRSDGHHRPAMAADPPTEPDVEACRPEAGSQLSQLRPTPPGERRRICSNGRLLEIKSAEGLAALRAANDPPFLFGRAGSMVSVGRNERQQQVILKVDHHALRGHLARAAEFYKIAKGEEVDSSPPTDMVNDIHALPPGDWGFPPLDAVTDSPVLRPDFSVVDRPGYDATTALFYAPHPDLRVPPLPEHPSSDHVGIAVALIKQLIGDFPFEDEASYANMVAALLTPIIRPAIESSAPMALLDAPQAGSGKSLLCDVVSIIATGAAGRMFSAPARDDDEWRKIITTELLSGGAITVFDNITRPLENGDLCSALTATLWADRIMKTHDSVALPVRTTFMASGNNIRIGGDMPRRCYRIRLDPKCSQPYLRTGPTEGKAFAITDLKAWTLEHRGELLAALLTLARAWHLAGQPSVSIKPLGSFERWTRTVGGILQFAGISGFMGNAEKMYAEADEEAVEWEGFLVVLHRVFYGEAFLISQIVEELQATTWNETTKNSEPTARALMLKAALPASLAESMDRPGSFKVRCGKAFGARDGTRFGKDGVHLKRSRVSHQAQLWAVGGVPVAGEGGED